MIGSKLRDRYELTEVLGRGGMGVVYRAYDPMLERDVAVKLIPPTSLAAEGRTRFRREARMVARLDHPAIVAIHDFGTHDDDILFIVMPLVDGKTLRHHIARRDLTVDEILEVGFQVADALDYSHRHGVIHRDIKPENIMISRPPGGIRVRVMDFGLARLEGQQTETATSTRSTEEMRLTGSGGFIGTVAYMSPEQIDGRELDGKIDLYAVGAVLYEVFCGDPPFGSGLHSAMYRIVHEPPAPLTSRGVELGEALDALLLSCLAKEPLQRPESGRHLADRLLSIRARLNQDVLAKTVVMSSERRRRHGPASPPLVGRQDELAALGARLDAALQGECQLVMVAGETGVGKTRLLEELDKLATVRGMRVLHGRFAESHTALPYHGLCDLVQDYARALERDGSSESVDLSDLAADLVQYFPMLSDLPLLRRHVSSRDGRRSTSTRRSSAAVPGGDAAARSNRSADGRHTVDANDSSGLPADWEAMTLYEVLARSLARIGNGQPLVLLLEHLHAGDVSLEALSYIVRRLGATPTLIVGTYRPSEVDRAHPLQRLMQSFYDDARWLHLHLHPLERRAFRQLLAACTQEQPSEVLLDRLFEATEGNPLFALELLRAMDNDGDLDEHTSSLWQFGGGIASSSLPATIQQAVQRRIDRLPHQQRQWLSVAAVIGRTFEVDALQHLLHQTGEVLDDENLDDLLDQLIDDGVLQEERLKRGDHLRFSSGVIADVLYRDLSRRRRRRLHRAHGAYLEQRHGGRLGPVLPHLVRHFSAGDVADKTVHYGVQLARDSLHRFSFEDAIRAARTALELADDDVLEDANATRGELHWLLAQAERSSGNLERAQHEASGAWRAADRSRDEAGLAKIALFQAETAWQARQAREARRWIERGIDVARHAELPGVLHRLLTFGATLANLQGQTDIGQSYLEESTRLLPDKVRRPDTPRGGILRTALRVPVTSLSPGSLWVDDAIEVLGNVFETLLRWDADGNLMHGLAESWQSDSRHRRFTFQLRQGVCFSDGTPLTAESVRLSMVEAMGRDQTSPIAAFRALRTGDDGLPSIQAVDSRSVAFELQESLPIFPALLTDLNTAVQRPRGTAEADTLGPLGSGPFRVQEVTESSLHLARNTSWWRDESPPLDGIVFQLATSSDVILQRLLRNELDLARDLAPHHLDEALRDSRFRSRRVEVVKKNIYFVLWNDAGPMSRLRDLRRLASGVLHPRDLVWRTLGRSAQPAVSFIPPGVLGHDAGRRRPAMGFKEAQDELARLPLGPDITLRCVVHPVLADRFRPLCEAIFDLWRRLGLNLEILGDSMEAYQEAYRGNDVVDVLLGRWNADYEDPDNFMYGLFHSRGGRFARFYSSPVTDRWLEEARQEVRSQRRIELYHRFEDHLQEESLLVPLMHDINDRLAAPRVTGLRLVNTAPYVNYGTVALRPQAPKEASKKVTALASSSALHVPVHGQLTSLDPVLSRFVESVEVTPNVFETLTRYEDGARVVPWLAESVEDVDEGRCYRIRLRPQVRFHDGRRLTTRDVRYSFERALVGSSKSRIFPMLPIRGSQALQEGRAEELEGLRIESSSQLLLELDEPLTAFPALLSFPSAAIVPEGCTCFDASWRRGCVGTGPFRVVELSEHQLVLDRNTDYWRPQLPRSERLVFHFGMTSEQAYEAFRDGQLSLVSDLRPRHVERLRRDPRLAMGYRESPRLATYFLVLNSRGGVFQDLAMRRRFLAGIEAGRLVRQHAARLMVPATGLIPPGLLGYEERPRPNEEPVAADTVVTLRAVVLPAFRGPYKEFWDLLKDRMLRRGWDVESEVQSPREAIQHEADVLAFRWVADYPDTDGFLGRLLHSEDGVLTDYCRNSEIDHLLNAGRRSSDPRTRHALYRQVEDLVAREALILPLFHEQMYRFHDPTIKGFRFGLHMPEVCYEELYTEPGLSLDVD